MESDYVYSSYNLGNKEPIKSSDIITLEANFRKLKGEINANFNIIIEFLTLLEQKFETQTLAIFEQNLLLKQLVENQGANHSQLRQAGDSSIDDNFLFDFGILLKDFNKRINQLIKVENLLNKDSENLAKKNEEISREVEGLGKILENSLERERLLKSIDGLVQSTKEVKTFYSKNIPEFVQYSQVFADNLTELSSILRNFPPLSYVSDLSQQLESIIPILSVIREEIRENNLLNVNNSLGILNNEEETYKNLKNENIFLIFLFNSFLIIIWLILIIIKKNKTLNLLGKKKEKI